MAHQHPARSPPDTDDLPPDPADNPRDEHWAADVAPLPGEHVAPDADPRADEVEPNLAYTWEAIERRAMTPSEISAADLNAQLDVPVTVNINGCPNSCARIQIADIGFKGQIIEDADGGHTEGFQVHLGGSLGLDSAFGRKLRQHKVTGAEVGDYIERVVRNFVKQREQGERFAQWAIRADESDLR